MAHTLFYDGVCGLCSRLLQFVLRHDRHGRFRFASLQGAFAHETLPPRGVNPDDLDTMMVVTESGELLRKGHAVVFVLRQLGGGFRVLATLSRVLPWPAIDWIYDRIAHNRYRIFGKYDACLVPDAAHRAKFL